VFPYGVIGIFKVDRGFAEEFCDMACANRSKPDKNIRVERYCLPQHPDVEQGDIHHFSGKRFPVTSQFFIGEPVIIQ